MGTFDEDGWRESSRSELARRLVEDLSHRRQQFSDADRLTLETVESSGHDSRSVLGHYRGRDRDDRCVMGQRIGPQLMQGFYAIDARQLNVHQDQRWPSLLRKADAIFTGLGLDGLVSLYLERVPHQLQFLGVVFDDQDQLIRRDVPAA